MKKDIISAEDLAKLNTNFKYIGGKYGAAVVLWVLRINKLNQVHAKSCHLPSHPFVDGIFRDLKLKYSIDEQHLKNIPSSGPFILIANHPFGGAEAIITLKIMKEIRPDFKYMANFLLNQIKPLEPFFIAVNPFETMKKLKGNYSGLKQSSLHLNENHPLGIFPAGEVSTFQKEENTITDKKWPRSIIKFIKAQEVPIIPMYFEGNNSRFFHFLGQLHPLLRTIKLPSELINKKNKTIPVKIGAPISVDQQNEYDDILDFTNFLRKSTYHIK